MSVQDVAAKVYTDPEDFKENPWPEDSYEDEKSEDEEPEEPEETPENQETKPVGGFDITKDYNQEQSEEDKKFQDYLKQFE